MRPGLLHTQALDKVRPYLGSHAGGVEYLGIDDLGRVHLRLQGSCDGCPASSVTVKMAIETAILEAAPEIAGVEVENVQTDLLQIKPHRRELTPLWISIEGPMPGAGRLVNRDVGGLQLLIAGTTDNLYAYASRCPACDAILADGSLTGSWLTCPACARRYDLAAAGRGSDDQHRLEPVPLVTENGTTRVAVPELVT